MDAELNPAQRLHVLGQSLWLDSINRAMLRTGALARYVRDLAVTGLTSNPTILGHGCPGYRPPARVEPFTPDTLRGRLSAAGDARPAPRRPSPPRPSVQRAVNRLYTSKALRST